MSPSLPSMVKLLARLGVMFGAFNSMFALMTLSYLFNDREQFIEDFSHESQVQVQTSPSPSSSPSPGPSVGPSPSPSASPGAELFPRLPGQAEAEKYYAERGWRRPLAGIALILSLLLLLGCLSALRGTRWGHSAWSTACALIVPFHVVNLVMERISSGKLPPTAWLAGSLSLVYSVVCLIYLRQARIRALFER